ncbi:hypothetical protein R1sor_025698 [Riccia sorocarpa]|uniref:Uncharacterized protein n=1 Tax=Riccia sorocarpa TaxID=122646 RepID=A0ABD3G9E7_9MARC
MFTTSARQGIQKDADTLSTLRGTRAYRLSFQADVAEDEAWAVGISWDMLALELDTLAVATSNDDSHSGAKCRESSDKTGKTSSTTTAKLCGYEVTGCSDMGNGVCWTNPEYGNLPGGYWRNEGAEYGGSGRKTSNAKEEAVKERRLSVRDGTTFKKHTLKSHPLAEPKGLDHLRTEP